MEYEDVLTNQPVVIDNVSFLLRLYPDASHAQLIEIIKARVPERTSNVQPAAFTKAFSFAMHRDRESSRQALPVMINQSASSQPCKLLASMRT